MRLRAFRRIGRIGRAMRIVSEPLEIPVVLAQAIATWAFFALLSAA
jgi:hypothetical protein